MKKLLLILLILFQTSVCWPSGFAPGDGSADLTAPGTIGGTTPSDFYFTNGYFFASGVEHGITSIAPTNDYGAVMAISSTIGGLDLYGITDADQAGALRLTGITGAADPTDNYPVVMLRAGKKNGTGWQALGDAETPFMFYNYTTPIGTAYGNGEWILTSLQSTPIGSTIASTGLFTTLGAGAGGFSVDADGDVIAKSVTVTQGATGSVYTWLEGSGGGTNFRKISVPDALTADLELQFPDTLPTDNQFLVFLAPTTGKSVGAWRTDTDRIVATFNGGGTTAIVQDEKAVITVPFNCVVTGGQIVASKKLGTSGTVSIEVDIWREATATNYDGGSSHPAITDTICAAACPAVAAGNRAAIDPATWGAGATLAKGDILVFNVDSVTDTVIANVVLYVTKQ